MTSDHDDYLPNANHEIAFMHYNSAQRGCVITLAVSNSGRFLDLLTLFRA